MRSLHSLRRRWVIAGASLLVVFVGVGVVVVNLLSHPEVDVAGVQVSGACAVSQPAFCETFDLPAGTGNRSGQLNGTLWGVSRTTGNNNVGGLFNAWSPTQLQGCGGTS